MTTPTGADAMKEAERLVGEFGKARWNASSSYHASVDTPHDEELATQAASELAAAGAARDALLAFIRKLVEAQPAAVPSADALAVADAAGWDRAIKEGMREIEAERAAPAAPLVGEPSQQPVAFYEQEPKGQSYKLFWTVPGLGVPAGAVPLYASPAAPAGVPTQQPVAWLRAETSTEAWSSWSLRPPGFPNAIPVYANLPARDSSEASGSAIPARPTLPGEGEHAAMQQVTATRMHLSAAIEAYERAGYGSHVTNPLRDALRLVEFSISEVTS